MQAGGQGCAHAHTHAARERDLGIRRGGTACVWLHTAPQTVTPPRPGRSGTECQGQQWRGGHDAAVTFAVSCGTWKSAQPHALPGNPGGSAIWHVASKASTQKTTQALPLSLGHLSWSPEPHCAV